MEEDCKAKARISKKTKTANRAKKKEATAKNKETTKEN